MKIIFFGTPEFAVPSLQKLHNSDHEVAAIVTAPDKERGRGRKVSFSAVKQFGVDNNIEVLQPPKLSDDIFLSRLKELNADLFIIVAFRILPEKVFTLPANGSFNLHGSMLPKYRGAAPIQWAIINGDTETGLTTFFLKQKVDTGNIILQKKISIEENDNFGTLHDKMSIAGADLVIDTVYIIETGNVSLTEQDSTQATGAPKITKETCKINWNDSAESIHNLVRGLSPFPGAYFIKDGKQYKVYKTKIVDRQDLTPGNFEQTKKELIVGCGKNAICILEIQPEGRKRMSAEQFVIGYSV
ncbi:MAG: methionyl-tRNA formyltransferase [Ignavibacteriae bacterium]|nr:methionyl-tRNA formyltransferase [Ignavibacteriota bacterium]NOG99896.1 methionyl-tRNA formyltransferase [Ignavibacteriota bacterium]